MLLDELFAQLTVDQQVAGSNPPKTKDFSKPYARLSEDPPVLMDDDAGTSLKVRRTISTTALPRVYVIEDEAEEEVKPKKRKRNIPPPAERCRYIKKDGEQCTLREVEAGLCSLHYKIAKLNGLITTTQKVVFVENEPRRLGK